MRRPWLAPFVPLYAAGAALRAARLRPQRLGWPVLSIGNLSVGGAGKTPLTIALVQLLRAHGVHVDVLSRGYGRSSHAPARVRIDGIAEEFGDEPLLIARATGAPVYVARNRHDAGLLAERDMAHTAPAPRLHILDDGFQHRQLARDIDVLLLRESDLTDALLPAGNLREPLSALGRATVIAVDAAEPAVEAFLCERISLDRNSEVPRWIGPIWRLRRTMTLPQIDGPVLAFCGIARPAQFFSGLADFGVALAARRAFRDHHRYTARDVSSLVAQARSAGAVALLTTEKDAVRLGALQANLPAEFPLLTAGLACVLEEGTSIANWLLARLGAARPV